MASQPPSLHSQDFATPQRGIPAWMMSGALHFTLFIALCFLIQSTPPGTGDEPDRQTGIALVKSSNEQTEYLTEEDVSSESESGGASSSGATGVDIANPLPTPSDVPVDLAGVLPAGEDFTGIGEDVEGMLPGAHGLLDGPKQGKFTGNQTQTGIFGLQGVGSKFVYVFDRSRSMSGYEGRPLAAAKSELIKSLKSLESTHQFQIVFYNEEPHMFNPFPGRQAQMVFGGESEIRSATDFVERVVADGSTQHMEALKLAVNMGPDVIFFLTDAEEPRLSESDLLQIRRWNRSAASINTIQFGSGGYKGDINFLVKLANQNDGRHIYVDVTKLPSVERKDFDAVPARRKSPIEKGSR